MDTRATIEAEALHAKFYYASEVPRFDCSPGDKRVGHWGVQRFEVGLEGATLFAERNVSELPLRRPYLKASLSFRPAGIDVSPQTDRVNSTLPGAWSGHGSGRLEDWLVDAFCKAGFYRPAWGLSASAPATPRRTSEQMASATTR